MGEVNIFFEYLKSAMKAESFTSSELIALLDKNMTDMPHEERVGLLTDVYKLWYETSNIDAYYKGNIMAFINYVEYRIMGESWNVDVKAHWIGLFDDLKDNYINETSLNGFIEVMNYHRLPNGGKKIKWLRSKADAVRFSDNFNFSIPEFNECFVQKDGKKIDLHDRSKTAPKKSYSDILIRHK